MSGQIITTINPPRSHRKNGGEKYSKGIHLKSPENLSLGITLQGINISP